LVVSAAPTMAIDFGFIAITSAPGGRGGVISSSSFSKATSTGMSSCGGSGSADNQRAHPLLRRSP